MSDERPVLRLIRGSASPEELAAVVAVLASRGGGGGEEPEAPPAEPSLWAAPALRGQLAHGPGAWKASGFPR